MYLVWSAAKLGIASSASHFVRWAGMQEYAERVHAMYEQLCIYVSFQQISIPSWLAFIALGSVN